jgi:hypothetical protein
VKPTRVLLPLLCLGLLFGCSTLAPALPRYTVTANPVNVVTGLGLCIAVGPGDKQGIWWWQPGPSGCASRIPGPTVFRAEHGVVSRSAGSVYARFTLPLVDGRSLDVKLALQDSEMRIADSQIRVSTQRRSDLDIPFAYGR